MGGWDSHVDYDFYVRAYFNCLESKRFLVKCYRNAHPHERLFAIQGTPYRVMISRKDITFSYTTNVPEHTIIYQDEVSTPSIVCMALTQDNFILVPEEIESPPLF